MPGAWDEQLHAMDYLAYAYLQGAQDKQAFAVLDELSKIPSVEPQSFKVAYAFAAIPARYVLERKRWDEATKLELPPNTAGGKFPWEYFRWAEAHINFARAIGFARTGDTASARREVDKLAAIRDGLAIGNGEYDWARQVDIERQLAAAWLAFAEGKRDEALTLMRAVADLDDATDKHPVTPGAILPAREQLGELLLELKQPAAALAAFETSLRSTPERFNGIYGAARAASLASDQKKAKLYYEKLIALTRQADSPRPEIADAKAFLALALHTH
jgi:tetratricopeptide (TPR) repeat protein